MKHRMFRIVIAVILVCALLVSWSPIRAQAVGVDQFIGVAINKVGLYAQAGALSTGAAAFAWVLVGLGIVATAAQTIELMNEYTEYSGEMETSIYYYPDGSWSYGVDVGFVDRVRAFLFHKGYVVDASKMVTTVPEGVKFGNYTPRVPCVAYQYSYHYVIDGEYEVQSSGYLISLIPNDPYVTSATSACSTSITVNGNKHYFKTVASGIKTYSQVEFEEFLVTASDYYHLGEMNTVDGALRKVFKIYGWTGIRGAGNVAIDYVAPLAVPMIEAYPEWHTNSRPATNPDTDEEITVLPIPLNPSVDPETQIGTLTQPDIWQGAIADPMPDTDTNPDTGTDTQPDSPGAPSTDIGKYQIDLKDFFPFCIPFDLYRFFEILCADPEAPVFHWEFNVFGELHSLDVDLSPWNPHAQLFRDAQVGLFIMGLLWITRKFIKW